MRSTADLPALVARSAQGDKDAFAEIYAVAAPRLFGVVHRMLGDRAQAEEVTQEAFLMIWRTCSRFDPRRGSPMSWMLTIARARAIDRIRQSEARTRRDATWALQHETPAYDSTAETVNAAAEVTQVRAALQKLSQPQRTAIFLAYFGGQTYAEVAHSLDVPAGTVKSRIRDGLKRLHVLLSAPDDGTVPSGAPA